MQKKTPDYDNVFKTMKSKHKRLFISVINDVRERVFIRYKSGGFTVRGIFD